MLGYRSQAWDGYLDSLAEDWEGVDLDKTLAKLSSGDIVYAI